MKISPLGKNQYLRNSSIKINAECSYMNLTQNNEADSFFSPPSTHPSFGGCYRANNDFKIIGQPEENIKQLAEIFHKTDKDIIQHICYDKYEVPIVDLCLKKDSRRYMKAYNLLVQYVDDVIEYSKQTEKSIAVLSEIVAKGNSNIAEQEQRISKTFFELLKIEQTGRKIPDNNGILIYGDAPNADKEEFVEWFKNNVPAQVKEFTYNESAPFESIKKLVSIAEDAEKMYQFTGKRTILHLKDMDKLLTQDDCVENRRMIGRFKQFAEHCSERYHTTLLMSTNYHLEDFEPASIGSQRFETLVKLKEGIKQKQKEELDKLMKEKNRLNNMAAKADQYYWYDDRDIDVYLNM